MCNPSVMVKSNPSRTSLSDSDPYPTQIPVLYPGALLAPSQIRHCALLQECPQYLRNGLRMCFTYKIHQYDLRYDRYPKDIPRGVYRIDVPVICGIHEYRSRLVCNETKINLPAIPTQMYFCSRSCPRMQKNGTLHCVQRPAILKIPQNELR